MGVGEMALGTTGREMTTPQCIQNIKYCISFKSEGQPMNADIDRIQKYG